MILLSAADGVVYFCVLENDPSAEAVEFWLFLRGQPEPVPAMLVVVVVVCCCFTWEEVIAIFFVY